MNKAPKIEMMTFGCRLNTVESQVMKRQAISAGLDDAIIVNTCAVTNEAVRQARQAIRKAKRDNPEKTVIVSGCAAQTDPDMFANMDEVELVLGNEEKLNAASYRMLPQFGVNDTTKVRVNDIMSVRETASHLIEGLEGRTRAFVQVQTGCDHRCTFCIIPFGRGNSRSVPMGVVVEQVRKLVENGYREVVITGVDITSYGADLPGEPKLGALIQSVLKHVPELDRLRLSSIDSIEVDPQLMDAIANEERLMPHLHLSLQSGDNMILKRMKRRHSREDTIAFCQQVRDLRPNVVFGADIIAGFPTETDEMFANSIRIVDECDLTQLHVFPFSPRPGTPAQRMPQLDGNIIKNRAGQLREKGDLALQKHFESQMGKKHAVLIEKPGLGRTEQYTQVELTSQHMGQSGDIIPVVINGYSARHLFAEAA